ncbi:hypothetical protein F4777DRAFT_584685 [Nemania sp. FL0916]|nr:hypothetical protein F4777DRAFT_584685 [Nemania sp. FL0916]
MTDHFRLTQATYAACNKHANAVSQILVGSCGSGKHWLGGWAVGSGQLYSVISVGMVLHYHCTVTAVGIITIAAADAIDSAQPSAQPPAPLAPSCHMKSRTHDQLWPQACVQLRATACC